MYENKEEIEKVILFAVDLDNGEQVPANLDELEELVATCLLYTSPSPRD